MAIRKAPTETKKSAEPTGLSGLLEGMDFSIPLSLDPWVRALLVGDTGAGKTAQLGLLLEYVYLTTGQTAVIFSMDKGGTLPLRPYEKLGLARIIRYDPTIPPWIWITHAIRGEEKVEGEWRTATRVKGVGLAAYEGLTSFTDRYMRDLARHSAANPKEAVGGESAWTYEVKDGTEKLAMASNTRSHYGLAQMRIAEEIENADPGVFSIWTALLARSSDDLGGGGVLGPLTTGKAQTAVLPRLFDLTMRIDAVPTETGARHVLYLETHRDKAARAKVIANARLPLAGGSAVVDTVIDPANIVKALLQMEKRGLSAEEEIAERIRRIRGDNI